ncbi:12449_t:CDS:1 [Dentiscutata heterogama]|uniref:12449_t:CDS:1 n=1 Tax=Dentiscutata heterogama TaxID=1316150 RepID=A0ACA9M4V0_9GLOM|nr:12449_t:CDS:1 [Dentiscutata heterogama]
MNVYNSFRCEAEHVAPNFDAIEQESLNFDSSYGSSFSANSNAIVSNETTLRLSQQSLLIKSPPVTTNINVTATSKVSTDNESKLTHNYSQQHLFIKIPFPPMIDNDNLVKQNCVKPLTAYIVYRYVYIKELRSRNVNFQITRISHIISESWKQEPKIVKEEYKKLAENANNRYNFKYQQRQQLQLPVNQSPSPATTSKSPPTHLNNSSSSTSAIEQEELCNSLSAYQTNLTPSNENPIDKQVTSKVYRTKRTAACNLCRKKRVGCKYSGDGPCELCVKFNYECQFKEQKKRGPKPGKKVKSNTSWEGFRNLSNKYIQEARKFGINVTGIIIHPSISDTSNSTLQPSEIITDLGSTSFMEEINFPTYSPEFAIHTSPLQTFSSIDYGTLNNQLTLMTDNCILDDKDQYFAKNM